MRRIFWDTMVFSYLLEANPVFGPRARDIHQSMQERGDTLCSSLLVLGEVLVGPLRTDNLAAAQMIDAFFAARVLLLPESKQATHIFSLLRAKQNLAAVDAAHLAVAGAYGVDVFLTNDYRLQKIRVPGISFIAPLDAALF